MLPSSLSRKTVPEFLKLSVKRKSLRTEQENRRLLLIMLLDASHGGAGERSRREDPNEQGCCVVEKP